MERKQDVTEKQIDAALKDTFPASDPVSLHSTGAEVDPKGKRRDGAGQGGREAGLRGWWRRLTRSEAT